MRRKSSKSSPARRLPAYGFQLTRGGALFLLGTILVGMAAIDSDMNLLMLLLGLGAAALVLNAFSGWRTLRALSVRRLLPDIAIAGQPTEIRYSLTNHRAWNGARGLRLMDALSGNAAMASPETFIPFLRPQETIVITVPAVAGRRGRVRFSTIRLSMGFPFGIFNKSVVFPAEADLVVLPALGRLRGDVIRASRTADSPGGGFSMSRAKGDEEFYGLREFREGDNPRRIHWRRSAQVGQLMIREMANTREAQIWCVVDTRCDPRDVEQATRLELAISAAATAICDALERGTKVGLICNGEPLTVLPPVGGRPRRARLLRELAIRGSNPDDELAPHVRRMSWPTRWRGSCLLFAAHENADLRAAARVLGTVVGSTTIYLPGTPTFDAMFICPGSPIPMPPGAHVDHASGGGDTARGVA
ncbi:MAG TPA: DUF58 domain-containing protein [Phycisphaerae bacterium]|nr:DUF58 domain-containing protein [Phycisphaerae bacterium]